VSIKDAREATFLDPTYVKAYWRLGQGLAKQKEYAEALEAYEQASAREPTNKAVRKEIELMKARVAEEAALLESTAQVETMDIEPVETKVVKEKKVTSNVSNGTNGKKQISSSERVAKDDVDDDVQFSQSDAVRGYKIVGGKKTSYFHRELTEEEKRLIGDIAPKKLDENENVVVENVPEGTSAWNKAGTWEEKDVTQWAKDTLTAALLSTKFLLPETGASGGGCTVSVSKVKLLSGHASVATVRSKRRYIFEFAITVEWELPLADDVGVCRGTLTFPDVDGTCDGEYDMGEYTVTSDSPSEAKHLLDRYVKNDGLRGEITKTLNDWVKLFEATYSI